jgi:hypothetical protein
VKHANTIVLGLGMPTLEAENGVVPMTVANQPGIEVSEVMFDAGEVNSPVLLRVGTGPATAASGGAMRATRRRFRTSSSASAARTSARPL